MDLDLNSRATIESIADVLANSHDWLSLDAFVTIFEVMVGNDPCLNKDLAAYITRKFVSLPVSERIKKDFNHRKFVGECILAFEEIQF